MANPTIVPLDAPDVDPTEAFKPTRSTFPLDMARVQSGGLDDDPTDSGDPVRNTTPFKNLTGGR